MGNFNERVEEKIRKSLKLKIEEKLYDGKSGVVIWNVYSDDSNQIVFYDYCPDGEIKELSSKISSEELNHY